MALVRPASTAGLAPLYVAVALGAFLLFLVQPMAARFILPWFGGGPWRAATLRTRPFPTPFPLLLTSELSASV